MKYVPVWSEHQGPETLEAEGLPLSAASVEEVIDATRDNAEITSVRSLTSYTVDVSLRGESRTYRAVFFWRAPEPGSEISFYAVDLVTQGVPEIALDPDLTVEQPDPPRKKPMSRFLEQSAGASSLRCDDYSVSDYYAPRKQSGTQGHFGTGKHYAQPLFEHECSCDRNCTSECAASVSPLWCNDKGLPIDGLCHKMSQGQDDSHQRVYSATSRGASCSSGFGCAVKSCVFGCLCAGVSVNVKASTSGASISFGSGALWTKKFSDRTTCAPCDSIQSPPSSPPPSDPTPIVIDLDRRGFRLTSVARGVEFDVDADGAPERVSWTDRRSKDAFLARDRNGNGVIDDGSELFGNFSPQDATEDSEKNGFRALAMFDKKSAGGNEDGVISARDAGSTLLILWREHRNHDFC